MKLSPFRAAGLPPFSNGLELKRIPFAEFANNLARIFERVIGEGEAVVVETEAGALVALTPIARAKTAADYDAFLASAGSWADVDTDAFLKDIYESRKSSRPPVSF